MYETEIVKLFGIMLLVKPLDPLLPTRTNVSIFFFRDSCVSETFNFFFVFNSHNYICNFSIIEKFMHKSYNN